MENIKQYLSVEDLSRHLSCTPQYVRLLIKKGKVPAQQVGKTWVIDSKILENNDFIFEYCQSIPDQIRKQNDLPDIVALSFFSGAMGLDYGLEKAGIRLLLASEIEQNARKTILMNKPDIGLIGDINSYNADSIRKFANIPDSCDIDLVIGGPPCQAFSTAGQRKGFKDSRGNVFLTFIDRILELRPKIAVIENVRGILSAPYESPETTKSFGFPPKTPDEKKGGALAYILGKLEKGGYTVTFNLYNAANYGAPQKRERVFFFCSRNGVRIPYLTPTNDEFERYGLPRWRTVREVLKNMREEDQEYINFPERRLKYYRMLSAGQYWKNLPEHIQKEALGDSYYAGGGKTGFLRRLGWDVPSPTLVTDPTMPATDLAHPERDRPLSVQEYKRIQEFPDEWKLFGAIKDKYRQIGNAVPISLGFAVGKQVKNILENKVLDLPPEKFEFSRYVNTDDVSFKKMMEKKLKKYQVKEPTLFD